MQKQQLDNIIDSAKVDIYVHIHPFRAVLPYNHNYETFAKSRWYGKPLLQTLVKQFKAYDAAYYRSAIEEGRITMNGKQVTIDYMIKNGDKLIHSAIREEPPILDLDIEIIQDNQDYLVVNKPPSFTVHTGGGFHYNTLSSILEIQKGYKNLFVLHRLDRLTSGLIIYGKTKQKPQIFHKQNQNLQMKKMYYARVTGDFPWDQKTLCAQIQCVSHKDGIYKVTKQIEEKQQHQGENSIQLNEQEEQKIVINNESKKDTKEKKKKQKQKVGQNPDLKDSKTKFKKVFYHKETDSSLVQCYPISGRTHQIRVHLQFLGFPILNDVVYGGRFVGNNIINTISYSQKLALQNEKFEKKNIEQEMIQNYGSKRVKKEDPDEKQQIREEGQKNGLQSRQRQKLEQKLKNEWDIKSKPWQICLHSYQYKIQGKVYKTAKPYWAQANFNFQIQ